MLTRRKARQAQTQPTVSTPIADQPMAAGQFSTAQFTSPANKSATLAPGTLAPGKIGSASGGASRDLGPVATGAIVAVLGGLAVVGVVAVRRYDPLAATGVTRVDVEVREVAQPPTPPKTESAVDESLLTDQSEDGPGTEPNDDLRGEAGADEGTAGDSVGLPTTVPSAGDGGAGDSGAGNRSAADEASRADQADTGGDGASATGQQDTTGSGVTGSGSPSPAAPAPEVDDNAGSPSAGGAGVAGTAAAGPARSANDPTAAEAPEQAAAAPRTPAKPPAPVQQSAAPAPTIVERPAASQPVPVAAPTAPVVFEGQATAVIEWSLGGGPEPSGFALSWSGGGREGQETLAATARRTQLHDLVPGSAHTLTIIPLGPQGSPRPESALNVSFRTLDADVGPPRPPQDLVVSAGPDRLTVSWTSEIDHPGTTGYFVSWGCCGGRVGGKSVFPETGQASFTIEGLQSGVPYQIDVLTLGANFVADPSTSRRVGGTPG